MASGQMRMKRREHTYCAGQRRKGMLLMQNLAGGWS
jgi:hypothetical protein